ncbi:MAG: DNA-binding response regulator [Deltaproteobacteria bacterium]|nr:MAG: DNA-binding response regulator [Deltaproteobacteria bacterium]
METIRLILVDDHNLFHQSIGQSLKKEERFTVVAQADSGESAIGLAAEYRPDIMIMDINMPDMNGMEATRQILAENAAIKILALTMHSEKPYVLGMLNAGAVGYLLKSCTYTELLAAIETVFYGKVYLSPDISHLVTNQVINPDNFTTDDLLKLSPREREVLQLIAEGHTSREIGAKSGISSKTVDIHRNNLKKKLEIHTIAGLTKFAIARGITSAHL